MEKTVVYKDCSLAESAEDLLPILTKYFDRVYCHSYITIENPKDWSNSAFFFSKIICGRLNIRNTESISFPVLEEFDRIFLDWRDIVSSFNYEVNAIRIVIGCETSGYHFCGYYISDYNILIASDWTHLELPPTLKEELDRFLARIVVRRRRVKRKIRVTLGCDPEFELIKDGRIIPASSILPFEGDIGTDGAGSQLELRPKPSENPRGLVKTIRNLLRKTAELASDLSVSGNHYPLGGHIHIGGVTPYSPIITVLDDFIGRKTIDLSGTARGRYKVLGAFEKKPWGFEYRTPPASIFHNPKIARIVLKIAKNVVEKLVRKGKLTYEDPPMEEDYIKIGLTRKEAEYFINFIRDYRKMDKNIFAFWKIGTRKTYDLKIVFRDDWLRENKNFLIKLLEKVRLREPVQIVIFGLKEERGKVATIPIKGYGLCTEVSRSKGWVGLPYCVRMVWNSEVEKELIKVAKAIKKYIREEVCA